MRPDVTGQDGMTLVETAITTVFLLVMLAAAIEFFQDTADTSERTTTVSELNQRAHRLLNRIAGELIQASPEALEGSVPVFGSSGVTYRRPIGYMNSAVQWGPRRRLELRPSPSDADDGIDNDSNGLVDECQIVLRIDPDQPGEQVIVIADDIAELQPGETINNLDDNGNGLIDEPGLMFALQDRLLTVSVSVQALGPRQSVLSATAQTAVALRN